MPQSLSNILIHIVFSTKHRADIITPEIEKQLYPYIITICNSLGCPALKTGGTANHVHILCRLSRTITVSKLVEKIKTGTSKWIKTKGAEFHSFSWQNGYGAFSIGVSNLMALEQYIVNQKEHHKRRNFKDELRSLLKKYEIGYDEKYLWD